MGARERVPRKAAPFAMVTKMLLCSVTIRVMEYVREDGGDTLQGMVRPLRSSMDNLATIFDVLRSALKVEIEVHAVEAA